MKKSSLVPVSLIAIFASTAFAADDNPTPAPAAPPPPIAAAAPEDPGATHEIAPEKKTEIEKMIKLSGAEKLIAQMTGQLGDSIKTRYPKLPPEYWQKFQQEMDIHALLVQIEPVYDKYYSLEDLKAINAFYESPVGQKMLATRPQVMSDIVKISQEWGRKLGQKIMEEIKAEKADDKKPDDEKPKTGGAAQ